MVLSNGGKITMLLGIITCFGPALVISVVYGCMPPVSASMLAKADIEKEIIKYTEGNFCIRCIFQFLHPGRKKENKISLNVGIGTGGTMNDAEMN